ncbi:GtrA family protein [Streptomyces sp. BE303]|uniref:GtrA family protein n=1 Tax=Streptomycetaceae TaxID=2062 RepID=UPI002E7897F6|nr:GtrA family protein [Streptomyces sp. BE303]MED7951750.1 GtrA family protein [Streptomyces sp. BE303]
MGIQMVSTDKPTVPAQDGPAAARPAGTVRRQIPSFLVIGVLSTLFYLGLYVVARQFVAPQAANLIALAVSAVANTAANRRFTFGITGAEGALRHQLQGAVAFLIGLGLSAGVLALLDLAAPDASRTVEVAGLVVANGLATVLRFVLMRIWVFKERKG